MRRTTLAALAIAATVTISGCSSAPDREAQSIDLCRDAANEEAGIETTIDNIEATNAGDLLFDAGITDDRDTSDENALFTVMGDVTWEKDGTESRRSMMCMVKFEDGEADAPAEFSLN